MYVCVIRSSYPDARDGADVEMKDGELPDEKTVEFDDDTLELTLPSGLYDITNTRARTLTITI